jgi:hypothetical protein
MCGVRLEWMGCFRSLVGCVWKRLFRTADKRSRRQVPNRWRTRYRLVNSLAPLLPSSRAATHFAAFHPVPIQPEHRSQDTSPGRAGMRLTPNIAEQTVKAG